MKFGLTKPEIALYIACILTAAVHLWQRCRVYHNLRSAQS